MTCYQGGVIDGPLFGTNLCWQAPRYDVPVRAEVSFDHDDDQPIKMRVMTYVWDHDLHVWRLACR